jgi:hypothetical protein
VLQVKSLLNLRAFRPFPTGIARGQQFYLQMISYIVQANSDVGVWKALIKAAFREVWFSEHNGYPAVLLQAEHR